MVSFRSSLRELLMKLLLNAQEKTPIYHRFPVPDNTFYIHLKDSNDGVLMFLLHLLDLLLPLLRKHQQFFLNHPLYIHYLVRPYIGITRVLSLILFIKRRIFVTGYLPPKKEILKGLSQSGSEIVIYNL